MEKNLKINLKKVNKKNAKKLKNKKITENSHGAKVLFASTYVWFCVVWTCFNSNSNVKS